jgi:hypothetical protein
LKHLFIQAEIGHDLPKLAVLVLELLQPPYLGGQQTVIFALPVELRAWLIPALRQISATGSGQNPASE